MPPRGHSSSSHSSRSHSSSHHSSSSHSSRSYSSSRRVSSHSSSSHSSSSNYGSSYSYSEPTHRMRVHQPVGYPYSQSKPTRTIYAHRHDYVWYPVDWKNENTGQEHSSGYYDEYGNVYSDLILEKDGRYENVPCKCEYCGQQTFLTLTSEKEQPKCPSCGANLTVTAALDKEEIPVYRSQSRSSGFKPLLICAGIFFILLWLWRSVITPAMSAVFREDPKEVVTSEDVDTDTVSNTDIYGRILHLTMRTADTFTVDEQGIDKILPWDHSLECYYDEDSDCYLWYNTDVSPNLWQYWYEGISSDYGDYGWMEYENGTWYIEETEGNWVELPSRYDTSDLWHILEE